MKCGTIECARPAGFAFIWPGRAPQAACLSCHLRAQGIATVMGFTLHTVPIEIVIATAAADAVQRLKGNADV